MPLCLVRPAIVNPSYSEPFPGWVDSLAAAAVLFLFVGLGVVKVMKGDHKKIGDVIPVDVVANNIIVVSAHNFRQTNLAVYHVGSSDRNPLTWGEIGEQVSAFWNSSKTASKISKSHLTMTTSPWKLSASQLKQRLPV